MRLGKISILFVAASFAASMLAGCGGGGASSAFDGTRVFAQDDTNKSFSHVWVTIDKVTLNGSSSTTTVFDDTAIGGRVVDLRSLWNDQSNAPQFLLLGQTNSSAGSYQSVSVTLEPGVSVVPSGSSSGVNATLGGSGQPVTFTATIPSGGQGNSVVVDFNLSKWTLTGTTLSAPAGQYIAVPIGTGVGSGNQHVGFQYFGQVGNLSGTAPNQTFTLNDGPHAVGTVQTGPSTVIYNIDGSANPALADGQQVLVAGKFDPAVNAIVATSVQILPTGTKVTTPHVMGVVTADDPNAGTLTVQPGFALMFLPGSASMQVAVSSSTTFMDASGVTDTEAEFFAAVTPGTTQIVASGTISGGVLQATTIKIIGTTSTAAEAAFIGTPSNANASAGTFDLTIQQFQGMWRLGSTTIHVTTDAKTAFKSGSSTTTESAFFSSVDTNHMVFVRGNLDTSTSTLAATLVAVGGSFEGNNGVNGTH
jgi:hypothetical protein